MHLLSVNVAQPEPLAVGRKTRRTGIFKRPSPTPVAITPDGLAGDAVLNTKHHGGPDQAVYVYGSVDADWWAQTLGRPLAPGAFGENLTIAGLASAEFAVGDRLVVGTAVLEITAPRIPCATLAARMGDPGFVKQFRAAERPGLYCRVIQPGPVTAGDPVQWQRYDGDTVTVLEMFRDFYEPSLPEATIRRYLAAPIAIRDRIDKEKQLAALTRP